MYFVLQFANKRISMQQELKQFKVKIQLSVKFNVLIVIFGCVCKYELQLQLYSS